jgi:hypothetical protein
VESFPCTPYKFSITATIWGGLTSFTHHMHEICVHKCPKFYFTPNTFFTYIRANSSHGIIICNAPLNVSFSERFCRVYTGLEFVDQRMCIRIQCMPQNCIPKCLHHLNAHGLLLDQKAQRNRQRDGSRSAQLYSGEETCRRGLQQES